MQKKILIVIGTRPEAIKMASLIKLLQKEKDHFTVKVCITAQHREMLDQVLEMFDIHPDYDLNIMKPDQDLFDITANILSGLKPALKEFMPNLVLVHGDTTTTLAASLAAYYMKIAVGHVEAGLRTGNIYSPWPEEINRKVAGAIAAFHFAPTQQAKNNLLAEGTLPGTIHITGNTVIDALLFMIDKINGSKEMSDKIEEKISRGGFRMNNERKIILVTGHRRENFGQGFIDICEALKQLAIRHRDVDIVYPVHLNPNVQNVVAGTLSGISNIYLLSPLEYDTFILLLNNSYIVLTDSGGVQEEAPSLGKPVLVMREQTERPEAVEAGCVKLVGTDKAKIIAEVDHLLENKEAYLKMSKVENPYGDGKAAQRIVQLLIQSVYKN
jgi:UDP-N-acetylglucosamine 2-epimerase (non-hydrolysing)